MCETVSTILGSAVVAAIISAIISCVSLWVSHVQRKKQNKYQDAKSNLHILLQILEGLEILEQAYIFRGTFCPLLEHKCPELSKIDGDGVRSMSYAQRSYQFQMVGYNIIRNCKEIIFLTPKQNLPEVVGNCKEILNFLCHKKSPDSKQYLDIMITNLISHLDPDNNGCHKDAIDEFSKKLREFYDKLNNSIEDELPKLSGQ